MDIEKAKLIKNKFSNFLLCDTFAFVAPLEKDQLKSFLELARNYPGTHNSLHGLLTDDSVVDKILDEHFSNADFEIYVAARNFSGSHNPQPFREHIRKEEIDFDLSRFL